jgi:hypothetical protein
MAQEIPKPRIKSASQRALPPRFEPISMIVAGRFS